MKMGVHARWLAALIFALPVHAAVTWSHDIAPVVYQILRELPSSG